MTLTGHELEIIPSVVAAIAIIGGYLGVRAANQNALKIAREERSSNRQNELNALKRTVYVQSIEDLLRLYITSMTLFGIASPGAQRTAAMKARSEANLRCSHSGAEIQMIAPLPIRSLNAEAQRCALNGSPDNEQLVVRTFTKLLMMMRNDLDGQPFSTPEELDRVVDNAPGIQPIDTSEPTDQ